jgi:hypothetical protein
VGTYGFSAEYHGVLGETEATGHSGVAGVNKKDGSGVYGRSDGRGNGVWGVSVGGGAGVFGTSQKWTGVHGYSPEFNGVWGETEANAHSGVLGINKKDRNGVTGISDGKGTGVYGTGNGGGVAGGSRAAPGVVGISVENHGVRGETEASERAGVTGINKKNGYGVHGQSEGQGSGVYGTSTLGRGVLGDSESHEGVQGIAHVDEKSGVVGLNDHAAGYGVWAASQQGTGLYAKGRTGAMIATDDGVALRIVSAAVSSADSDSNLVEAAVGQHQRVFSVSKSGDVFAAQFGSARPEVAEKVKLSDTAEMGDVVEIDPNEPGSFRLSRTANSSAVAGVLVASPGLKLGGEETGSGERDYFLCLLGRVPVKVTFENGPIHPGDLLVASGTPGRAMKAPAEPKPGTVIGKALGKLSQDQGEIEMLVMLR